MNFIIYASLCVLLAYYAKEKDKDFGKFLIASFFLTPIIVFIYLLLSKKTVKKQSSQKWDYDDNDDDDTFFKSKKNNFNKSLKIDVIEKEYLKNLKQNEKIKLWFNPNIKNEIRAYVRGYTWGEGLISKFNNEEIYSFLEINKKNLENRIEYFDLIAIVSNFDENYINLEISTNKIKPKTNNDLVKLFHDKLIKKYNPKPTTTFTIGFTTDRRILPKKHNKSLSIGINFDNDDAKEFSEIIHSDFNEEGYKYWDAKHSWLNSFIWLEFEEKKISFQSNAKDAEICKILRAYNSGFKFIPIVIKDRWSTENDREKEKNGDKNFHCWCSLQLVKP